MCCARTAAQQGGYEKQKENACRDFLQQSLHHVRQCVESYQTNAQKRTKSDNKRNQNRKMFQQAPKNEK